MSSVDWLVSATVLLGISNAWFVQAFLWERHMKQEWHKCADKWKTEFESYLEARGRISK